MERNATLDIARLVAAFGIVWFHVGAPGAAIGYAALPFFLIVMMVMAAPGAERMGFTPYAKGRAERLLRPWLLWSAIYAVMKLAELVITGAPFASEFAPHMLLTGPALHLWFLPFAFLACLLVYPAMHLGHQTQRGPAIILLTGAALLALGLAQGRGLPVPLAQWVYAGPAVCLGLAMALAEGRLWRIGLILFGFTGLALAIGWTAGLGQLALAGTALWLCLALPRPGTALSSRAAAAAMGIYLAHPLALSLLLRLTDLPEHSLILTLSTSLGALLLSQAVQGATHLIWHPHQKSRTALHS